MICAKIKASISHLTYSKLDQSKRFHAYIEQDISVEHLGLIEEEFKRQWNLVHGL